MAPETSPAAPDAVTWQRIAAGLERIAGVLERAFPLDETDAGDEPAAAPSACTHPVELRIDFGVTDGRADWQCGVKECGYRSLDAPVASGGQ